MMDDNSQNRMMDDDGLFFVHRVKNPISLRTFEGKTMVSGYDFPLNLNQLVTFGGDCFTESRRGL